MQNEVLLTMETKEVPGLRSTVTLRGARPGWVSRPSAQPWAMEPGERAHPSAAALGPRERRPLSWAPLSRKEVARAAPSAGLDQGSAHIGNETTTCLTESGPHRRNPETEV